MGLHVANLQLDTDLHVGPVCKITLLQEDFVYLLVQLGATVFNVH